jgi:hypothetical protein
MPDLPQPQWQLPRVDAPVARAAFPTANPPAADSFVVLPDR